MKTFLVFSLLLFISCGDDNFKKVEVLDEFRILAITSDLPEVAPGSPVNLQLLVSDPKGNGRSVEGSFIACADPGIATGATPNCTEANSQKGEYAISGLSADDLYTGLSSPLSVTIPENFLEGRSQREKFNGVAFTVFFSFNVDGKVVTTFKRINVTSRTPLNINPSVTQILRNGSSIGNNVLQNEDKLQVESDDEETYDYINVDGTVERRVEQYEVAWYISSGKFDKPKAPVNDIVEYEGTPEAPLLLIAIVRDERGGVALKQEVLP